MRGFNLEELTSDSPHTSDRWILSLTIFGAASGTVEMLRALARPNSNQWNRAVQAARQSLACTACLHAHVKRKVATMAPKQRNFVVQQMRGHARWPNPADYEW